MFINMDPGTKIIHSLWRNVAIEGEVQSDTSSKDTTDQSLALVYILWFIWIPDMTYPETFQYII
jgi:hypothetical protein